MINRRLLAEFIGTFFLVFIGAGSAAVGYGGLTGNALATGLTLFIFISFFASTSGAHFNPAVTWMMYTRGCLSTSDAVRYTLAQLVASFAAAGLLYLFLFGSCVDIGSTRLSDTLSVWQGFGMEAILTFFLAISILRSQHLKEMAPLLIGITLTCAILVGGPLTGASLNPARSLGPCLFSDAWQDLWLYFTAPFFGAWLASLADRWFSTMSD